MVRVGFGDGVGTAPTSRLPPVLGTSSSWNLADAPRVPSGLIVLALLRCVRGGPNEVPAWGRTGFGTVNELPSPVPSN